MPPSLSYGDIFSEQLTGDKIIEHQQVFYIYLTTSIISDKVLQPKIIGEKNKGGTAMPVAKDRVKGLLTDRVKGYLIIGFFIAFFALVLWLENS